MSGIDRIVPRFDSGGPGGRPPKYDPNLHPDQAFELCLLGYTNEKIAAFFKISEATFYNWQEQHPEFLEAVTRGKEPADAKVALGLYKRGTGYDQPTEKLFMFEGEVVRAETLTHIPPDPGAALNWLKNRQPDLWRDKKQLELEDQDGQAVAFPVVRIYGKKPEDDNDR